MIRRIHLHQGPQKMRAAAHHFTHPLVHCLGRERRRPIAIVKERVLATDLQDILVAGRHPERVKALNLGLPERLILPQPRIGFVDSAIGIGGGIGQQVGLVLRDSKIGGVHDAHLGLTCFQSVFIP